MGTRGRKSAAELSVISAGGVEMTRRPEPPAELTGEQSEAWQYIVAGYDAGRFDRGSQPLLAQYCRHVVAARHVGQLLEAAEKEPDLDVGAWDQLLKTQERQSARMASLATKLRITPQSRYMPRGAARADGRAHTIPNPWES